VKKWGQAPADPRNSQCFGEFGRSQPLFFHILSSIFFFIPILIFILLLLSQSRTAQDERLPQPAKGSHPGEAEQKEQAIFPAQIAAGLSRIMCSNAGCR